MTLDEHDKKADELSSNIQSMLIDDARTLGIDPTAVMYSLFCDLCHWLVIAQYDPRDLVADAAWHSFDQAQREKDQ